jgi:hypothetical protein
MRKSKSGLKFTRVGVEQKIVVGSLLRSKVYGSRIARVLGFWTGVGPSSNGAHKFLILTHHANTSWVEQEVDRTRDRESKYRCWRDPKGGRHVTPVNNLFINHGYGWEVVVEVK